MLITSTLRTAALCLLMALAACANIDSIERRTVIPRATNGDGLDHGVAIHLDAKQRIVFVNSIEQYCAEPSPDALAAFASSLGLGASVPSQGAASLAQALQSSAASIGLRTQSITLMRDALYRICEAYVNKGIGPSQIMTLLARSQDLTAVILAVEQLTGAVASNQVILGGTAGAGSSASRAGNPVQLDLARKNEDQKTKELEAADAEEKKLASDLAMAEVELAAAKEALDKASAQDRDRLQRDFEKKTTDRNTAAALHDAAVIEADTRRKMLAEAKRAREQAEKSIDAGLTSAIANTTTSGHFGPTVVQRNELSPEATKEISIAVREMVGKVLDKDYTLDSCVALVTNKPTPQGVGPNTAFHIDSKSYDETQEACLEFIRAKARKLTTEIKKLDAEVHRLQAETEIALSRARLEEAKARRETVKTDALEKLPEDEVKKLLPQLLEAQ